MATANFYLEPKPVQQPHPPYIIGGNTEPAMKRACRLGDGWYGIAKELSGALDLVRRLRELEKIYQRPKLELTLGLQWHGVTLDDVRSIWPQLGSSGSCPRLTW